MKRGKKLLGIFLAVSVSLAGIAGNTTAYAKDGTTAEEKQDEVPDQGNDKPSYKINGWKKVDGDYYYYKKGEKQVNTILKLKSGIYYMDKTGKRCYGWKTVKGNRYYFQEDGKAKTGWMEDRGKWYFFDVYSGILYRNIMLIDTGTGKIYIFDKTGKRYDGWCDYKENRYYIDEDGSAHIGWKKIEGHWYYFHRKTAAMYRSCTVRNSAGKKYIFDSKGICKTRK